MSKVVHFEPPADDPKRAIAFYEKVFGWKGNNTRESVQCARHVVYKASAEPRIVLFVTHQDEQKAMEKLDLVLN